MSLDERLPQSTNLTEIADLLNNGANIEAVNEHRETPLIRAIINGDFEITNLLISRGARLFENVYFTAFIYLYSSFQGKEIREMSDDVKSREKILVLIINNLSNRVDAHKFFSGLLFWSIMRGFNKVSHALIQKDVGINFTGSCGFSPLNMACMKKTDLEIVKSLVEHGDDVNWKTDKGDTPLITATKSGNLEMVGYLISVGVDVDCENDDGETALSLAEKNGNSDLIAVLSGAIII